MRDWMRVAHWDACRQTTGCIQHEKNAEWQHFVPAASNPLSLFYSSAPPQSLQHLRLSALLVTTSSLVIGNVSQCSSLVWIHRVKNLLVKILSDYIPSFYFSRTDRLLNVCWSCLDVLFFRCVFYSSLSYSMRLRHWTSERTYRSQWIWSSISHAHTDQVCHWEIKRANYGADSE